MRLDSDLHTAHIEYATSSFTGFHPVLLPFPLFPGWLLVHDISACDWHVPWMVMCCLSNRTPASCCTNVCISRKLASADCSHRTTVKSRVLEYGILTYFTGITGITLLGSAPPLQKWTALSFKFRMAFHVVAWHRCWQHCCQAMCQQTTNPGCVLASCQQTRLRCGSLYSKPAPYAYCLQMWLSHADSSPLACLATLHEKRAYQI